jgi:predicted esterase
MKNKKSKILILALCLLSFGVFGQEKENFPKGKLIEKVQCSAAPEFSYVLYLPSTYDDQKKWPILFCFDPRANGMVPAKLFQAGAEKYGYIIMSSNNSGSDDASIPNAQAMKEMYDDAFSRFSVDNRRLYATGMSGGARIACDMGYRYPNEVAGVIGCAAGFPTDRMPSKDTPFAYFGTIGNLDFNYLEIRALRPKLEESGIPFHIRVFDGEHQWPTPEIATEALEWMEVIAMKTGKREKDPALIEDLFAKRLAKTKSLESILHEAADEYTNLSNDFETLRDVSKVTAQAAKLNASEEVRSWREAEKQRDASDQQFRQKLASVNKSLQDSSKPVPTREKVMAFLEIESLLKKAKEAPAKEDRLDAQRLLELVSVQHGFYMTRNFMETGDYARAVLTLSVVTQIHPEEPWYWYALARAQTQLGQKEKALQALERAVKQGWDNSEKMASDFDLKPLHDEKQFQKILEATKKNQSKAKQ